LRSIQFTGILLIFILGTSTISVANAQLIDERSFSPENISGIENQLESIQKISDPKILTDYKLSLAENLSITPGDDSGSTDVSSSNQLEIQRKISMKERLAIKTGNGHDAGIVLAIKNNLDRKAIFERIFSQERTRLEKSVISNYLGNEKIYDENEIISINQDENYLIPEIPQLVSGLLFDEFTVLLKNEINPIFKQINSLDFSEYNFIVFRVIFMFFFFWMYLNTFIFNNIDNFAWFLNVKRWKK